MVIDKYVRERGLTADEAAERMMSQAEKFKSERDILRGKIDEVNEVLMENPVLMEEHRAKRDKPKGSKH